MTKPKLVTIPFSHYCEKARWALERCGVEFEEDGHLPLFHYLANLRHGGKRTVPLLVDGKNVVRDSTDIVAWADAKKPGTLIPLADSETALAIEDDFDTHFGPAARRWGYYWLLPNPDADRLITSGVPRWEARMLKFTRPLAISFLRRGLKVDAAGVERSRQKINATLERVDEVLSDGRRYLLGDRFSIADLTLASLAAPIILPPGHPVQPAEMIDLLPAEARAEVDAWRATRAGKLVLRLYAEERRAAARRAA